MLYYIHFKCVSVFIFIRDETIYHVTIFCNTKMQQYEINNQTKIKITVWEKKKNQV